MSCKICGRSSCASFMHSIEEQERFDFNMPEDKMRREIVTLRDEINENKKEIDDLRAQIERLEDLVKYEK